MHTTQLTRFLDPAAESRALLTRSITVLGLDPDAFASLPRMSKAELDHWLAALQRARQREEVPAAAVGADGNAAYDRALELEGC
jgi:hypothetical protein